ncbi:hypothetical protein BG000_007525 [Podila horticola]|nr:hypothetical protein BG000_007525 [Podila horticola]
MDPTFSTASKKRHDTPELPQLKHSFSKQQMQMPLHPPRRSFSIPTHANLASTFFPQYAPSLSLPLSSPISSTPGSPLTRSSFFTRRPSTSFHYMTSHGSSSTLSLSTPWGASSPASATFFGDLDSSLEGGDKFTIPFDMDAIDLRSENEVMQGHIEELDEEEDGLEDLDEDVESTTDETDDDSDTDTDSDGGSSEHDNFEVLDWTNGSTGLEDIKARTQSSSMTLGLFETYRQTAFSNHATVATNIIARRSSISSDLSVAWSSRITGYDDDDDDTPSSQTEQDTLTYEMTSSPVTAPIRSSPFETPLQETITAFEANIPDMEGHNYESQMVQEDNIGEEDSFEDDAELDVNENEDKEETHNGATDERDAIMLMVQTDHNPEQDLIQVVGTTLEDAKESTPSPSSFIGSQEMDMDAMDHEEASERASTTLMTDDADPSSLNTPDQNIRPTSPYRVWSYLEEATKQESGSTSRASTPPLTRTRLAQDTVLSSRSMDSKTVCSDSESSSGLDSETTPSSPVSPPPYAATLKQEMKSKNAMTMPMKITSTGLTTTRLVSRSLKSRMSSALRSGFTAAAVRVSSLTFLSAPELKALEENELGGSTQDDHGQATSGTLELEVLRLQAEITVLHERIDRLEMDRDGMAPSSNKRNGPESVDRSKKSWTVRSVVMLVLKKGLIHAVLVIVVWVVCYKRQKGLRMASDGWRYLQRTKRWIVQRARR